MKKTLLAKIKSFEQLQVKLASYGATDSEARQYFRFLLKGKIMNGSTSEVLDSKWFLYDIVGSKTASKQLTKKAINILKSIDKTPFGEVCEAMKYYGFQK